MRRHRCWHAWHAWHVWHAWHAWHACADESQSFCSHNVPAAETAIEFKELLYPVLVVTRFLWAWHSKISALAARRPRDYPASNMRVSFCMRDPALLFSVAYPWHFRTSENPPFHPSSLFPSSPNISLIKFYIIFLHTQCWFQLSSGEIHPPPPHPNPKFLPKNTPKTPKITKQNQQIYSPLQICGFPQNTIRV